MRYQTIKFLLFIAFNEKRYDFLLNKVFASLSKNLFHNLSILYNIGEGYGRNPVLHRDLFTPQYTGKSSPS